MGEPMRKMLLLAVLVAGLIVTTVSPALAQEAAGQVALPEGAVPEINEGSLYAGPYEVTEEGDLIYGGDVSYRCEDLPKFANLARSEPGAVVARGAPVGPFFEEAIGLCAQAGFPREGVAPRSPGADALPETGGITLPPMPVVASILAAGAHLILRARRRPTTRADRR